MLGSRNLTKFLGLERPWTLEKNLLLPFCWTSIIPYYILNPILIHTDKHRYQPSSNKPLLAANGGNHRQPQLDTIQKSMDCEEPSPS